MTYWNLIMILKTEDDIVRRWEAQSILVLPVGFKYNSIIHKAAKPHYIKSFYDFIPCPESLSRASRYFDLVFSIISCGNFGGGGCFSQSRPFR